MNAVSASTRPPIADAAGLDRDGAGRLLAWILDSHLTALSHGDTGLDLGPTAAAFDAGAARLEGLSRLLWGAVPALVGGIRVPGLDRIVAGLAAGTDPAHPDYWGEPGGMDQRLVEMAAIAFLLREAPQVVTRRLGEPARHRLHAWLATIERARINPSNWRFFRVLVLDTLAAGGWAVDRRVLADELDFIDRQYVGAGWYKDGDAVGRFDHYNPFAFHFYGLLYARWHGEDDPVRSARFVARARAFALAYRSWFAPDGAGIAYGRSMTYRFGMAGFWGLMALAGHPDITPGQLRGLWARALGWWLDKPIFDAAGRLTVGYAYPNLLMSEFYNSAQSPLWALKAFAPLMLPATHPFWTEPAEPAPPAAPWAIAETRQIGWHAHGVAYLACPPPVPREVRRTADKYAKFAYSSHHGFGVEALDWIDSGFVGDNILALARDGGAFAFRDAVESATLADGTLTTVWSPFPGCRVITTQRHEFGGETRSHTIDSDTPLRLIATGHAVDLWQPPRPLDALFDTDAAADTAPLAQGETLFSDLTDLDGRLARRIVATAPNTNLIHPHATVPALAGRLPAGRSVVRTRLAAGLRRRLASAMP